MLDLAPIISGTFLKIDGTVVITAAAVTVLAVPRNIWIWALYIVLPGSAFIHTTGSIFIIVLMQGTHIHNYYLEKEKMVLEREMFILVPSISLRYYQIGVA